MESRSFLSGFVLGAALLGVGIVIWNATQGSEKSATTPDSTRASKGVTAGSPAEATHEMEALELKKQLAQAKEQIERLESERSRQPVALANTEDIPRGMPTELAKLSPLVVDASFKDLLEKLDWDAAGDVAQKMPPLIAELLKALAEKGELPENIGDIQKLNGELVNLALKAKNAGVPGTGINGSFTHPSVSANLIYAALEKGGKPLNPEQRAFLQNTARQFSAEDAARLANYDANTLDLQKLLDESKLKDRFYSEMGKYLTPEQRNLLYNDSTRGRVSADIWSSGILWQQYASPVLVSSREDFGNTISKSLAPQLSLSDSDKTKLNQIVEKWARQFPEDYFSQTADAYSQNGWMKMERVREAAERQIELHHLILSQLHLSEDAKKILLKGMNIGVPFLKPR